MTIADLTSRAAAVGELLRERGQTVAVAESSAGGLIAAALLAVPGASAYFKGGGVVYTTASKQTLIGLSDAAMADARAATEPHALHLARAAKNRLDADWGIGETGAAGPVSRALTLRTGSPDRWQNMLAFAAAAIDLLRACVEEAIPESGDSAPP